MEHLQFFGTIAAVIAIIAYFFPVVGVYMALCLGPCAIVGVAGGVLGMFAPLRVPDWIQPVKNRRLFVLVTVVNGIALSGAALLAWWSVPRTASPWELVGATLLAGLTVFLLFRYEGRHRYERVNSRFMQRFPDMRGAVVIRSAGVKEGRWERLGKAVLTSVLSSMLTWMLGIGSGIELGQFSLCLGGVTFLRVSASMFA